MNPERRALLAALFLLALSGAVLHLAAHPVLAPDKAHPGATVFRPSFVAAAILPLFDLFVVTALFGSRRTAAYGYALNGMIVIYGTVLMGHFGLSALADLAGSAPFTERLFKSMFIDIVIVWADFFVGKALFDSWLRGEATET